MRRPVTVEATDEAWQDQDAAEVLRERERVSDLGELVVDKPEVLLDRHALSKRDRAIGSDTGVARRVDELEGDVGREGEEGLVVVGLVVLPHHPLAQPVALALRAAVLEGGVHHEGRAAHHVRHA
eukprot:7247110-Prymnesium_polylepis.1